MSVQKCKKIIFSMFRNNKINVHFYSQNKVFKNNQNSIASVQLEMVQNKLTTYNMTLKWEWLGWNTIYMKQKLSMIFYFDMQYKFYKKFHKWKQIKPTDFTHT